ncbi:hypothetical protein [Leptospira yanagawae]|uniref:hypothetical protein n=1 Tax=Leptospira yanagawae TaxID=293069 RepID=UPI000315B656|nr:hypothetical protein [Leptospira yanagawae]
MKKLTILILFVITGTFFQLSAKCFGFSKNKEITVCIDGNNNAARQQAQSICKANSGNDCGNITGYSGNCSASGKKKCLDASGSEKKSLKAD